MCHQGAFDGTMNIHFLLWFEFDFKKYLRFLNAEKGIG